MQVVVITGASELHHDYSNVRVTMVNLPAVNTPQFRWLRSHMPHKAQPFGTIFEPEVAARAIVWASGQQSPPRCSSAAHAADEQGMECGDWRRRTPHQGSHVPQGRYPAAIASSRVANLALQFGQPA